MLEAALGIIRYGFALLFGVLVSVLLANVPDTKKNRTLIFLFSGFSIIVQVICWRRFGLEITSQLYPFIVHLPLVLFLAFCLKRPWLVCVTSVLTAYLCCQAPRWVGFLVGTLFQCALADHLGYIGAVVGTGFILFQYVIEPTRRLMEKSTRSCLLFAAMPLMYYLFDYATTIYTDLLYSGSHSAVQFMPSVVSIFYFVFVLLYYGEMQKHVNAQRDQALFARQLQQAKGELENMRQMQETAAIYRHDMRHHFSLIGTLAARGEVKKIQEYLAEAEADIEAITPVRYCENETVNLILSFFAAQAKKRGVTLCPDVALPAELPIGETELCSLLSNALENAVAAAAQMKDQRLRKVYVCALVKDGKLVVSTENSYVGVVDMDGELPVSARADEGHGFGVKSIAAIVERHGGLYSFTADNGIFVLRLLLPLRGDQ